MKRKGGSFQKELKYSGMIAALYILASLGIKFVMGPYYEYDNFDPSYAYIFNSLNIIEGFPIELVGHPGTPLQILISLFLPVIHVFKSPDISLVQSILQYPEFYTHLINGILVSTAAVASVYFYFSARILLSRRGALFVQCLPLFFFQTWHSLYAVKPETLLLSIFLFIGALILREFSADEKNLYRNLTRPVMLGLLIGVSMMAKITAAPMIIFFMISKGIWRKIICILSFLVASLAFLPFLIPKIDKMQSWFSGLLLRKGYYGQGEIGAPELLDFTQGLYGLVFEAPIFWILLFILLVFYFLWKRHGHSSSDGMMKRYRNWQGISFVFLAVVFQVLIVLKHPKARYLFPSMAVMPAMAAFFLYFKEDFLLFKKDIGKISMKFIILLVALGSLLDISAKLYEKYGERIERAVELQRAETLVASLSPASIVAYDIKLAGYPGALFWGVKNAGQRDGKFFYQEEMKSVLGLEKFFFFPYLNNKLRIWGIPGPVNPVGLLQFIKNTGRPLFLILTPPDLIASSTGREEVVIDWMKLKPLFSGNSVKVYQLVGAVDWN